MTAYIYRLWVKVDKGVPPIKAASVTKRGNHPSSRADRLHTRGLKRKKVERETGFVIPRFVIASGLIVDGVVTGAK